MKQQLFVLFSAIYLAPPFAWAECAESAPRLPSFLPSPLDFFFPILLYKTLATVLRYVDVSAGRSEHFSWRFGLTWEHQT